MLPNKEGQHVPNVTFKTHKGKDWVDVTTSDLFDGKKVVVFSLPGAYTPTCSTTHLPRFNELATTFKANGIDDVICMAVNDAFVMNEWGNAQQAENLTLIPLVKEEKVVAVVGFINKAESYNLEELNRFEESLRAQMHSFEGLHVTDVAQVG